MQKFNRMCILGAVLSALACGLVNAAPMGSAFTYQGRLMFEGQPASGIFECQFNLYDAMNGGNLVASIPMNGIEPQPEDNGLFTTWLDFGPDAFNGEARWLEISVRPESDIVIPFTALSPRQEIMPAPYAGYAAFAGGFAVPMAITQPNNDEALLKLVNTGAAAAIWAEGTTGPGLLAVNNSPGGTALFAANLGTGPVATFLGGNVGIGTQTPGQKLTVNGVIETKQGGVKFPDGSIQMSAAGSSLWAPNGNMISNTNSGGVGIGTSSPAWPLHVVTNGLAAIRAESSAPTGQTTTGYFLTASDSGNGIFATATAANGSATGVRAYSSGSSGVGIYGRALHNSGTNIGVHGETDSTNGYAGYFEGGKNYFEGNVGIGTSGPTAKLHVNGNVKINTGPLTIDGPVNSSANSLGIYCQTTGDAANIHNDGTGNAGVFQARDGNAVKATILSGVGTAVHAIGSLNGDAGYFEARNGFGINSTILSNGGGVAVNGTTTGNGFAGAFLANNAGGSGIALQAVANGSGVAVNARASGSGRAGTFLIDNGASSATALHCKTLGTGLAFHAEGTARVDVLEIMGADVAEKFPVSESVTPGTVVMIDANNAGKLCASRGAYNARVAGVVSGANGLPAGTILGNLPGNENAPPIALSGRVWTMCDAGERSIEIGDSLTTADRAGHAMVASDRDRAGGAMIGKAMTALPKGETGLVLVLVNLQ